MDRSHGRKAQRSIRTTRRLICTTVLAVVFLLAMSGLAFADTWTDISDATWQDAYHVSAADAFTVAEGYPDNTFRPDQAVTRGQFAKMAVDGLGLGTSTPLTPTFSDVPADSTFFPWVEGAVDAGIIAGFGDGTFRPETPVSREQANSILGRFLSQKELSLTGHIRGDLTIYPSLGAWYAAEGTTALAPMVYPSHYLHTAYLVMRGVVLGSSSGASTYLKPLSELTRAQAVTIMLRAMAVVFQADLS